MLNTQITLINASDGISRSKLFNLLLWQRINYTVSPTDINGKWHAPLSSFYFGYPILSCHIRRPSRLQFACLAIRDPKILMWTPANNL